jgi:hypothetical protein
VIRITGIHRKTARLINKMITENMVNDLEKLVDVLFIAKKTI